jgi:hypothetical protein
MSDRPTSEQLLAKWVERSALSEDQVQSAALDVLDFVGSVLEAGGKLYAKLPGDNHPNPLEVDIPGLTTEPWE